MHRWELSQILYKLFQHCYTLEEETLAWLLSVNWVWVPILLKPSFYWRSSCVSGEKIIWLIAWFFYLLYILFSLTFFVFYHLSNQSQWRPYGPHGPVSAGSGLLTLCGANTTRTHHKQLVHYSPLFRKALSQITSSTAGWNDHALPQWGTRLVKTQALSSTSISLANNIHLPPGFLFLSHPDVI